MSARIGAYELEDLENVEDIENLSPRRAPSTRDQGVGISVVGGGIMAEVDADGGNTFTVVHIYCELTEKSHQTELLTKKRFRNSCLNIIWSKQRKS